MPMRLQERKRISFLQLKDESGQWRSWVDGLENLIENFYEQLFTTQEVEMEKVLNYIEERISTNKNCSLNEDFTMKEVEAAIFSMHLDKNPGLNSMNPVFFRHFWNIIGNDVSQACLNILHSRSILAHFYDTLVLIPKKKVPETMNDIHPISLYNVMMKTITKMLANRLKLLLPRIISETQSAFITGRLITDNVIASFEMNHWMHRKTQGNVGYSVLKIDLSKAYDRVKWSFVMEIMRKIGFGNQWLE